MMKGKTAAHGLDNYTEINLGANMGTVEYCFHYAK